MNEQSIAAPAPGLVGASLGLDTKLPAARQGGFAAAIDNVIYHLAGGVMGPSIAGDDTRNACWSLMVDGSGDFGANPWKPVAPIPVPLVLTCGAVANGRIHVLGGFDDRRIFSRVAQSYDPATNTWLERQPMPTPLLLGGAAAVGSKIYMIGGSTYLGQGAGPCNIVQVYDASADRWSQGPTLPEATYENGCAAIGTAIYSVGGSGGDFVLDTVTQEWSPMPTFPGRSNGTVAGAVVAYHRFVLVFGGVPARYGAASAESWYFDTLTNTWATLTLLAQARGVGAAAVLGETDPLGLVYFIGGVSASTNVQPFQNVEVIGLKPGTGTVS